MPPSVRPLSPHLQIYRPQLTSGMSIFHRATGIALGVGAVALVAQLVAAAEGEAAFSGFQSLAGSWFGLLCLFGWSLALFYHLACGIRHLAWDAGFGLELAEVYFSGKVALGAALGLTILTWVLALFVMGGH
jgi:succinate dehydrogenase / fumarate reductase cytochrome b subunit